jgi:hypothetical protein
VWYHPLCCIYRRSYHIFLILFTHPRWCKEISGQCAIFSAAQPQLFRQRKKWLSKSNSWQEFRTFGDSAYYAPSGVGAARKHTQHTTLCWAEIRAPRLRQFVFCAFTCHPNGGISDLAFLSRTDKKVFIFISSSSSAAERHQASAAESHHGDDLQFVLSVFFALCAKNASRIIFSSRLSPVIKRL